MADENEREILSEVAFIPPGQPQNAKLAVKTALVRGQNKIIHDRLNDVWEFYDLARDPDEIDDLSRDGGTMFRELSRRVLAWESNVPHPTAEFRENWGLAPEELERLRSLGYVE